MSDRQNKSFQKVREPAKPMPRSRLVPITKVIQAISDMTNGRASIPELADALLSCYDLEHMVMYMGCGYGLAEAIDGDHFDEFSGFNERTSIACEFINSRYWIDEGAIFFIRSIELKHDEILMTQSDGTKLAFALWEFFETDTTLDVERFIEIRDKLSKVSPKTGAGDASTGRDGQSNVPAYLDTSHPRYTPKLAAAVNAWLAFENAPGKTVRQSMERWLLANAGQYGLIRKDGNPNKSAITELSKVANWDTNGGPAKTPG